jgi:transcriptional regulator with XRE-family HTH domain
VDDETRAVLERIAGAVARAQRSGGLSTEELAARSTVAQSELEEILRGEADVALHTIYLLAGALGIRPAELLQGIEWVPDGSGGGEYRLDRSSGV